MSKDLIVGLISLVLQLGVPVALLALGFFVGRYAEGQHYASIHEREARFARLPVTTLKSWDTGRPVAEARMVSGSVVISADYFKRLLAKIRNLIGGRLGAYESLLDRARREAILRLKEQCPDADLIVNLRMETSTIGSRNRQHGISCVELIAYGTAIKYRG